MRNIINFNHTSFPRPNKKVLLWFSFLPFLNVMPFLHFSGHWVFLNYYIFILQIIIEDLWSIKLSFHSDP
jgi:hypothetical protein